MKSILTLLLIFSFSPDFVAQETDVEQDTIELHSPKRAGLLSAILPSAGQFYNKKYWKMPLVYAGLGTATYFIIDNSRNYKKFRNEYIGRIGTDTTFVADPELSNYADNDLRTVADTYKRWRDMSYFAIGAVYALQIIDAVVDAHFFYWETKIKDDISFRLTPTPNLSQKSIGLRLSLKL